MLPSHREQRTSRAAVRTATVLLVLIGNALSCNSPTKPSSPSLTATIGSCKFTLATGSVPTILPVSGGTFTVELLTEPLCAWSTTVSSALDMFVNIASTTGTGSATITVTVSPHTGIETRKIEFTIATMTVRTQQSAAGPPAAGPNAVVLYTGTVGEPLSFGQAGVATTDQYKVTASDVNGHSETVKLSLRRDTLAGWPYNIDITLAPQAGSTLAVGLYDNALRFTGAPGASHSMFVGFSSYTCDPFQASFEIFDVAFNSNGSLQRLHAKIVNRCLQSPGTSLTLEAWYPSKGSF
jgi:hypothetical protein